jgi:hypothetical protein
MLFFIEYLKHGCVPGCPMHFMSPNAPSKRDVLGTVLLSVPGAMRENG